MLISKNLYSGYVLTQLPFHVTLYIKSFYPPDNGYC